MRFRTKPVVIEAIQFDGSGYAIQKIVKGLGMSEKDYSTKDWVFRIHTLEGAHTVSVGDWVIKGIKGEFYPCKPDIFEATYEVELSNETTDDN